MEPEWARTGTDETAIPLLGYQKKIRPKSDVGFIGESSVEPRPTVVEPGLRGVRGWADEPEIGTYRARHEYMRVLYSRDEGCHFRDKCACVCVMGQEPS